MTVGDVLSVVSNLLNMVEGKETLFLLTQGLVIMAFGVTLFYTARNSKKVLRYLTFRTDDSEIEILDVSNDTLTQKMPVTVEDVQWYLGEVKKKNPNAIRGINKIILCNRPKDMHPNILGSYTPNDPQGVVIRLYTIPFVPFAKQLFTLDFSDLGKLKLGFTPKQTRSMLLFTLGHEIGHHVMYKRSRSLFGTEVEDFCDKFSADLQIVRDPEKDQEGELFHIEDVVYQSV